VAGDDAARDSHDTPRRGRQISARAAMYAAGGMFALGLAGGWVLARSSVAERMTGAKADATSRAVFTPPIDVGDMRRFTVGRVATPEIPMLNVVDRSGRPLRTIAAERPWTPRFSPDGRRVAYGAFGPGRSTSDLWVMDLNTGTTTRLTDDDDDSNDPQWSPDGTTIAYSAAADGGKDLLMQRADGSAHRIVAEREGTQFPSDWLRDGSALMVTEAAGPTKHDIIVQPSNGTTPRAFAATAAEETAARVSPDGRWVAYTSDESGRAEVYLDSFEHPGRPMVVSLSGGMHPVWRGDGRELYYWNEQALVAVRLGAPRADAPPAVETRTLLFRAPYLGGVNTMYDVSPDGQQFVIVRARETPKY